MLDNIRTCTVVVEHASSLNPRSGSHRIWIALYSLRISFLDDGGRTLTHLVIVRRGVLRFFNKLDLKFIIEFREGLFLKIARTHHSKLLA